MAEQETARLCRLILQEHFGDIPARVATALLLQGRLPLPRLVKSTSLRSQRIANALLVLIQHNLVWHTTSPSGQEIFELNEDEVLMRIRYGRYLVITEEVFDDTAVEIVSHIMHHGRVRAGAIIPTLVPDSSDHKSLARYSSSLLSLVQQGYIKATSITLQTSPTDRLIQFEADASLAARRAPTAKKGPLAAKEILEVKAIALKRLEDETREIEGSGLIKVVKDRTLTAKSAKRPKTTEEEEVVDENVYLRINTDKYNLHIRNEILVAAATHRYNTSTASVLSGALSSALPNESSPRTSSSLSPRSLPISFHSISQSLPPSAPDLTSGMRIRGSDGKDRGMLIREYVSVLCGGDNLSTTGREGAFMALTMSDGTSASGGSSRRVTVEYAQIAKRLRAQVLDNLVRDKWGVGGLRILNVLRDCGKLDGEQIAKKAMLKKSDIQQYLKSMSSEGLISSYEMARTADRTPSRSIYLWFIDTPRTYASVLFSLHRTLANILTRLTHETSLLSSLLLKRSRTDVAGNEEQWMSRAERERLEVWEEKRMKLGVLMRRVDESCFVLRDMVARGGTGYAEDDPYVAFDPLMK